MRMYRRNIRRAEPYNGVRLIMRDLFATGGWRFPWLCDRLIFRFYPKTILGTGMEDYKKKARKSIRYAIGPLGDLRFHYFMQLGAFVPVQQVRRRKIHKLPFELAGSNLKAVNCLSESGGPCRQSPWHSLGPHSIRRSGVSPRNRNSEPEENELTNLQDLSCSI